MAKWLTMAAPVGPEGIELLLEPNDNPIAKTYQKVIFKAGIPATSFAADDVQKECERMTKLGVVFRTKPPKMGPATVTVLDDTCRNQLAQV